MKGPQRKPIIKSPGGGWYSIRCTCWPRSQHGRARANKYRVYRTTNGRIMLVCWQCRRQQMLWSDAQQAPPKRQKLNSTESAPTDEKDKKSQPCKRNHNTHVFVASDPFVQLDDHNRLKPRKCRETKSGAPNWKLEYLIGPLISGCHAIKAHVKCKSRGLATKLKRMRRIGQELTKKYGTDKNRFGWLIAGGNHSTVFDQ